MLSSDELIYDYFKAHNPEDKVIIYGIRETSTNVLVAYAYGVLYFNGNFFDLKVVKFDPDHQKNNISELLFYEIGRDLVLSKKVSFVFDGFKSIAHKSGIQDYLIRKFNYRKAYCNINIYYQHYFLFLLMALRPFKFIIDYLGRYFFSIYKIHVILVQENIRRDCNKML